MCACMPQYHVNVFIRDICVCACLKVRTHTTVYACATVHVQVCGAACNLRALSFPPQKVRVRACMCVICGPRRGTLPCMGRHCLQRWASHVTVNGVVPVERTGPPTWPKRNCRVIEREPTRSRMPATRTDHDASFTLPSQQ